MGVNVELPSAALEVSGNVNIDNGMFFVDASNNRVGIGKANPMETLDISGNVSIASSATTPAGISWRTQSGLGNQWRNVCWSPERSLFVAVAESGSGRRVMTSPDGLTWTPRTTPSDQAYLALTWAPELSGGYFVALGYGSTVGMMSQDGITWTQTTIANNNWISMCWSPQLRLFVALSFGNSIIGYSNNGINWTNTSAQVASWRSVCWAPNVPSLGTGLFVAVGDSGVVATSSNGTSWTARTAVTTNAWYSVCWSPELYLFVAVAISGTGNRVMTSSNGIDWTLRATPADISWYSVCWAPEESLFVAVAYDGTGYGNRVMTSPDGIRWTLRGSAANGNWNAVCYSSSLRRFVAVNGSGSPNSAGAPSVMTSNAETSSELITVNRGRLGINNSTPAYDVDISGTLYSNGRITKALGGVNWTARAASEANQWRSVCWSPELSLFVTVALTGTNRVMTSSDGITWTVRPIPTDLSNNAWWTVCWAPNVPSLGTGLFVAVAEGGTNRVMTSPDGITWTPRTAAELNSWVSVCWSPQLSLFVAVAETGTNRVMTSPNGINWTARAASEANQWVSVCWSPELSLFVAVANTGTNRAMTSPNGINWTARAASEANSWVSVCWSPQLSRFVSVANSGTNRVMTSDAMDLMADQAAITYGRVGLGTTNPQFPLHITSSASIINSNTASIYTVSNVWCQNTITSSDSRIKTNIQDLDDPQCLNLLNAIQPKTYEYIDKERRGDKPVYGFIAQQIQEVLPPAVSIQKEFIPNVFTRATFSEGRFTISDPSGEKDLTQLLSAGDKVRIYDMQMREHVITIVAVDSPSSCYYTSEEDITGDGLVYGKEISDFHTLNKDYIFTVNVCATQELSRKVDALQQENNALKERIDQLSAHLNLSI